MRKILLLLTGLVLTLTGCASGSSTPAASSPAASASAAGELVVGMELAYPPFETKDAAGNPSGVSVDLARELGHYLGREVRIENIAWDGLIPSLQSGAVDVVISSMTITEERAKVVTFSEPYARAYLAFLVAQDSPVQSVADLNAAGRTVAVKKGTTGEILARTSLPDAAINAFTSENAAVTEVVQGKADAFVYDQLTIYRQARQNPGTVRMLAIPDQQPEGWGAAVRLGNDELAGQINEFIAQFRSVDGFADLTRKYLAEEKATFDELGFRWFFE